MFCIDHCRLTPEDAGRRGVVWNKFGLRKEEWQITMEVNIHSKSAMSGDGFGVFILDENDVKRPKSNRNKLDKQQYIEDDSYESLLGNFYGIRKDFNGTAVIFDTYDNDNNGDNPLVFSIINDGTAKGWGIDSDLDKERETIKESVAGKMLTQLQRNLFPTECTLDYHGKESVKILIRYQSGQLHVYTDKDHKKVEGSEADKINLLRKHALPFAFGRHLGMAKMLGKIGIGT